MLEICRKESYATKRAAERAKKHKWLRIYRCQWCRSFHFTKQKPGQPEKPAPTLSAAKVRRKLMANQTEIESQMRRLREADEQLQREQERARRIAADAEKDHAETVAALNQMVDRHFAMTGRTK